MVVFNFLFWQYTKKQELKKHSRLRIYDKIFQLVP